jgi:NAD(P)-dependent dehydrogenase (short-subunit alcohol dehydrogenase family)
MFRPLPKDTTEPAKLGGNPTVGTRPRQAAKPVNVAAVGPNRRSRTVDCSLFPTSATARAGLACFTKIFAETYAADNIRMNNVLPGWIDSLPGTEERRASVPLGRYGKAEEIAATIAFLASEGAAYITGQNIRVDGGVTRSV